MNWGHLSVAPHSALVSGGSFLPPRDTDSRTDMVAPDDPVGWIIYGYSRLPQMAFLVAHV